MSEKLNVETLGQVFTQNHTVDLMLKLMKNNGLILEPSCGAGAFSGKLPGCVAIELDPKVAPDGAINIDFLSYPTSNVFETIIGNPPYVKFKDISEDTKKLILSDFENIFDERSNLYLFFIWKCLEHLKKHGELIFITPREFLKATSSIKLNNKIFDLGTITDFIDLGDSKVFDGYDPNCVIWRFEVGNFSRKTNYTVLNFKNGKYTKSSEEVKTFTNMNGQLCFVNEDYNVNFNDLFYVKVGAVSGADEIFKNNCGNRDFVYSKTIETGKTQKYIYNVLVPELIQHKQTLLNRKIKSFSEKDWFMWGRNNIDSEEKRIYVNCKTRKTNPFFVNDCNNFDGSVLGVFLKDQDNDIEKMAKDLNKVNWYDLGFVCNGRFIFSQKNLENCMLPSSFQKYLKKEVQV